MQNLAGLCMLRKAFVAILMLKAGLTPREQFYQRHWLSHLPLPDKGDTAEASVGIEWTRL